MRDLKGYCTENGLYIAPIDQNADLKEAAKSIELPN